MLDGWAKIDRTIRQLDEEKVRDCKEDVDTLLVFVSRLASDLSLSLSSRKHRRVCTLQS